jgi:protein ATS1
LCLQLVNELTMPLYALGSNSCHQLSLGHTRDVDVPSLTTLTLPPDQWPAKIVAGGNHTLLLTNTGELYVTGGNTYGQCLLPPCEVVPGFTKADGVWKDCAATWEGSVAVDNDGRLWIFGRMKGVEASKRLTLEDDTIEHVFGGVGHFIALGKFAYGYGNGSKGQFGPMENDRLPAEDIKEIACGRDFSCLLSRAGQTTVFTSATKYNLHDIPPVDDVQTIATSWATIAALTSTGRVISWGRSDRGQYPPPNLPPIAHLAAGSEHFIALSQSNKVYAWGWNEHGNCAQQGHSDVTTLHEIPFPEDELPSYVAGGCGTSWIWTTSR